MIRMNFHVLLSLAFALAAIAGAYVVRPRLKDEDGLPLRIALYWGITAILCFIVHIPWVRVPVLLVLAIVMTPKIYEQRAAYYIAVMTAVSINVAWYIPFPGVNFLMNANHGDILAFAVAAPLWVAYANHKRDDERPPTPFTDGLVIFLWFLTSLLLSRGPYATPTNFLRVLVTQSALILLPYFICTRGLINRRAFEHLLSAFVMMGAITVAIGAATVATNWNFYTNTSDNYRFLNALYRGGPVRVLVTSAPTLVGIIGFAFMIALVSLRKRFTTPKIILLPWLVASLGVIYSTGSRGAIVGIMAGLGGLFVASLKSWPLRVIVSIAGITAALLGYQALKASGFESVDEYGTFEYRQLLLELGIDQVMSRPFLGDVEYFLNPRFEVLRQGQGIIDFVNTYLQLALRYGLFGLGIYLYLIARGGLGAVRASDRIRAAGPDAAAYSFFGPSIAAILAAFAVSIFTISDVTYIPHFLMILVGVSVAFTRLSRTDAILHPAGSRDEDLTVSNAPPSPPPKRRRSRGNTEAAPEPEAPEPVGGRRGRKRPVDIDVTPGVRGWGN